MIEDVFHWSILIAFHGWWALVSLVSLILGVSIPPAVALTIVRMKKEDRPRPHTDKGGPPGAAAPSP